MLYVIGVPIGHPDDITLRALKAIREADIVASENPTATRTLLQRHGIHATLTSYGPANLDEKIAVLIQKLRQGASIALVSDCGSPVISDPGCRLVAAAHANAIRVQSVPGPSALTAAVAASGLAGDSLIFQGQMPEAKSAIQRCVAGLLKNAKPTVLFCTANSLAVALSTLARATPRRLIVLACDLTKPGETIIRGTPVHVQRTIQNLRPVEDVTLIVAGKKPDRKRR